MIDFNFADVTHRRAPDRIYSFRNLGKARLTGLETEVQYRFDEHFKTKLGYTYLHAINDSDSDMPRHLLDRPRHKLDLGRGYANEKGAFRAALWGSFYGKMLDSNSVKVDNLFQKDADGNYVKTRGEYKEKSFGIWNLLLEKDLSRDATLYFGIDNIFNKHDDERAYQDRTLRFGMNSRFDRLISPFQHASYHKNADGILVDESGNPVKNIYKDDFFLSRYSSGDNTPPGSTTFYGDYRLESNMHGGKNKAEMHETKETQSGIEASRNHADRKDHGINQRLRLGAQNIIWQRTLI